MTTVRYGVMGAMGLGMCNLTLITLYQAVCTSTLHYGQTKAKCELDNDLMTVFTTSLLFCGQIRLVLFNINKSGILNFSHVTSAMQ